MYRIMLKTIIYIFKLIILCDCYLQSTTRTGDYDQIVFNQSHPITAYWFHHRQWPKENNRSENIQLSEETWKSLETPSDWIISSFWPSKNNGHHPTHCYTQEPQISISENYLSDLRAEWPTYSSVVSEVRTWEDAWKMHGTCLKNLYQIGQADHYLEISLGVLRAHNLGTILRASNYVPGSSYMLHELKSAIERELHIDPFLQCVVDESSPERKQYLFGGSMCLNKLFALQECKSVPPSTCDENKHVFLPKLLTDDA